jgi:hypothetical protein
MLPPKIMLISTICSSPSEISRRCSPGKDLGVSALLEAASFYDPEKFYILPDHVQRCNRFCITSVHCRGIGWVSFPSDLRIVFCGSGILRDPSDLLVPRC